jgi:hypothetical protein
VHRLRRRSSTAIENRAVPLSTFPSGHLTALPVKINVWDERSDERWSNADLTTIAIGR